MLATSRASARALRGPHWRCLGRQSGLLIGQSKRLRWGEGQGRLFTSHAGHKEGATAGAREGGIDVDMSALQQLAHDAARAKNLPPVCPGCGAPSQTVDTESAGYYGPRRVQKALRGSIEREEEAIFQDALRSGALADSEPTAPAPSAASQSPICDRCHYLIHQSRGTSIIHPSMHSIRAIIEESPHKYNHIYHVLDAADFPLSLIPNLAHKLALPRLRSQNRRSRQIEYVRGRQAEVSFIIARADLLAPEKGMVDRMLPELREMLRDALGREGRDIRLGNLRCVSAQRGWWTPTVKEEIWRRGGAGWMVGKVNVGKSALFEVVFPKGRKGEDVDVDVKRMRAKEAKDQVQDAFTFETPSAEVEESAQEKEAAPVSFADSPGDLSERLDGGASMEDESYRESRLELGDSATAKEAQQPPTKSGSDFFDEDSSSGLLPAARAETPFPDMPLVSSLPGTTASPIRIPFGSGKGELIDLPGIHRSSLDTYILPEHRKSLVMKSRVKPEQYSIKPGQSILLGGMIRLTSKSPEDAVFLAYPFVPLEPHVTATSKAIGIQTGFVEDGEAYTGTVPSIATQEAKAEMKSAGTFKLQWDVTKTRSGPLTSKVAGKMKAENLPFIVYSADLLIEGVGWVEIVCQVPNRKRSFISDAFDKADGRSEVPEVEVFTPKGLFVGVRRPLNAWVVAGPKKVPKHKSRGRPRMSIDFQRRREGGRRGGAAKAAVGE